VNEPTNADLYNVLLDIKEDIGGLKTSASLQLEGLKNHSGRIIALEDGAARQKGAAKVWTLVGSATGAIAGAVAAVFAAWVQAKH
jgi:arginine/lysine/ornithine decarboxylase